MDAKDGTGYWLFELSATDETAGRAGHRAEHGQLGRSLAL